MRSLSSLALLLAGFVAIAVALPITDAEVHSAFADFETRYNKVYANDVERTVRIAIFRANLQRTADLNAGNGEHAFGITKFSDMTPEEFRRAYLMPVPLDPASLPEGPLLEVPHVDAIPVTFDWRNKSGVLTPVKNQQQCGSCWAFSATEQIESVHALAGKGLVHLAPQQIVDCDKTCYGCGGGWTQKAFEYVISAGGQERESDYPYVARDTSCSFDKSKVAATISKWSYVSQHAGDENSTMLPFLYSTAPISVCVDASSWQFYSGGVLKNCGQTIDHCVQITGFSRVNNEDVWIVRNSWGADWGVEGFIYVPRNKNACAIATVATTVHV